MEIRRKTKDERRRPSHAVLRLSSFVYGLLLLVFLAGCASVQNGQAVMGDASSPAIFSFDGRTLTAADFEARLERDIGAGIANLLAEGQTREQIEQLAEESNVRGQIFDQLVQDALLARYARQHGIGVDAAAVDAEVLAAAAPVEGSPFLVTAEERLRSARNQLSFEVIARNTRTEMADVRLILLADEAAADQVLAELAGGADFAAIARERSNDVATAEAGGELGWVPRGNNPPELDEVIFAAPLNTPTKVASQFGVYVVEVRERQESRPFASFEQLRTSANAQQFFEESFLPWYEELRREAENSGELQFAPNFDPATVPLPFPEGTP